MSGPLLAKRQARCFAALFSLLAMAAHGTVVDTGDTQCCSSIAPTLPPATYYGATMFREDDPRSQWRPFIAEPTAPAVGIDALLAQVDALETRGGPMAAELSAPLGALGAAYLARKDYRAAIRSLRRGIHLARVNEGLDSPGQAAMLEQLIAVYISQGDFVAADEQQRYLFRVHSQQKELDYVDRVEATMRYADWVRGAYLGDLGRARYPRLVVLNDLYEHAIEELEQSEGENSPKLLPYLQARAELSYLISVYPGEQEAAIRAGDMPASEAPIPNDGLLRFWRLRDHNFRYGLQALERKRDILMQNASSRPRDLAAAHIEVADWHQWHRRYAQAIRIYQDAWAIMADAEAADSAQWLESQLGAPLELPQATIFNPGTVPLQIFNDGEISIAFDVNRHGEAKNISFLTPKTEATAGALTRGYHYLRNIRFRPRLEDGKVVRTEQLQRTYKVRY